MKPTTRTSNAFKLTTHPLYTSPYRWEIPWILSLSIAGEIAVLICAAIWSFGFNDFYGWYSNPTEKLVTALRWLGIPIATLIISLWDMWLRWRRTLSPKRAVVTASIAFVAWGVYAALARDDWWVNTYFLIWATPGLTGSLIYLLVGAIALHRTKKYLKAKEMQAGGGDLEMKSIEDGEQPSHTGLRRGDGESEQLSDEQAEGERDVEFGRGEEVEPSRTVTEWYAVASSRGSSTQLPAYSGEYSQQDVEVWNGGDAEYTRGADDEQPKSTAPEWSAGTSSRAASSIPPGYRSSVGTSICSEELRRIDVQTEKRSWCGSSG